MFAAWRIARRVLPFIVVLWASLAMIGGAAHLVNEAEAVQDSAAKAGIGLCAVSLAFFAGKAARRVVPPVPVGALVSAPDIRASVPQTHRAPPPPAGVPLLLLLQVSRT